MSYNDYIYNEYIIRFEKDQQLKIEMFISYYIIYTFYHI